MARYFLKVLLSGLALLAPALSFAVKNKGIGDFAGSLIAPVGFLNNFIGGAALVIGVACLLGAFFKYKQYRINPLAAPLSSVMVLLILGLILLGLPFLYRIIEGVPFTLY